MIASFASSLPAFALIALIFVIVGAGIMVCYALCIKGDVFAELSHGKTTFRLNAKDRRQSRKP
jgi:hypothetical protein